MAQKLSEAERDRIVRTIVGEAGGESSTGRRGVAAVILNRMARGGFGDSVDDVTRADQFETWTNPSGPAYTTSEDDPVYQEASAELDAALGGDDPTFGAVNFFAPELQASLGRDRPNWAPEGEGQRIGGHEFFGGDMDAIRQAGVEQGWDDLDALLGGAPATEGPQSGGGWDEVDTLLGDAPKVEAPKGLAATAGAAKEAVPGIGEAFGRGVENTAATVADVIGAGEVGIAGMLAKAGLIEPETAEGVATAEERRDKLVKDRLDQYRSRGASADPILSITPEEWTPSAQTLAELGGELASTGGPLAGILKSAGAATMKMLPGFVGKALTGAELGAAGAGLVSSGHEGTVADQMKTGAALGAGAGVAAPALGNALGFVGRKAGEFIRGIFGKSQVNEAGVQKLIANQVDNSVATKFEEAGKTIDDGIAMAKANPEMTLTDLAPNFRNSAEALAARGGKPTATMKTFHEERMRRADAEMEAKIDAELGPKPDITAESKAIQARASEEYDNFKKVADEFKVPINVNPLVRGIDKALRNAVGSEKTALAEVRANLLDAGVTKTAGKEVFKSDMDALLKVRQELDGKLKKKPSNLQNNERRALQNVRDKLDARIKNSNPAMKRADEIYSSEMDIKEGVEYGRKILDEPPEDAIRTFNEASDDVKEAILLGNRWSIGKVAGGKAGADAAVRRALGKGSDVHKIMERLWGDKAERILKHVEDREIMRVADFGVARGSQSADKLKAGKEFEVGGGAAPWVADMMTLLAGSHIGLDAMTSLAGVGARRAGAAVINKRSEKAMEELAEGVATALTLKGPKLVAYLERLKKSAGSGSRGAKELLNLLPSAPAAAAIGNQGRPTPQVPVNLPGFNVPSSL